MKINGIVLNIKKINIILCLIFLGLMTGIIDSWKMVYAAEKPFMQSDGSAYYNKGFSINITADKNLAGKGGKINVKVVAEYIKNETKNFSVIKITPPSCTLLKLIDSKQISSSELKGDKIFIRREYYYSFKSIETGEAQIQPAVIEFTDDENTDEIRKIPSKSLPVKIIPATSFFIKRTWPVITASIALLMISMIIFYYKKIAKRTDREEKEPLEAGVLDRIRKLRHLYITGNIKEYFSKVTDEIELFVKNKYNSENSKEIQEELKKILSQWSEISEKVKFSGHEPTDDEYNSLLRNTERYFGGFLRSGE